MSDLNNREQRKTNLKGLCHGCQFHFTDNADYTAFFAMKITKLLVGTSGTILFTTEGALRKMIGGDNG